MATASLRYEASSPDGSQFLTSNGHRASSSMDRPGSFRDSYDSRGAVSPPVCDSTPLSGVLSLEQIPLNFPDVKRMPNSAAASVEEAAQVRPLDTLGPEELKRVITDNSRRARDRARHLGEAIQKLDRFVKKRCRPEPSSERANGGAPAERPAERPVQVKAGSSSSADAAKKGLVPSKRPRTSIAADVRDGGRPSSSNIKKSMDRESPRPPSMLPSPREEKVRTPAENWDKTRLKGRRSGIKSETGTPAVVNGTLEQDREHKWAAQQHRMSQETRARPSEAHGLRSGPVHGVTSVHKGEASLQMNGSTLRAITKGECDSAGADRLPKNGLKPPIQDDLQPVNSAAVPTKAKAARAPRSGSVAATNPSHCARVSTFTDREKAQGLTKVQQPSSTQGNRKRPAPSRSSSPVAQWVGQRPQKMARVARRVNLLPGAPLPSTDVANGTVTEPVPERDPAAAVTVVGVRSAMSNSSATGVSRRVSAHSPTQGKPRSERAVALSESGESEEVGDSKLKDKGRRQGEWDSRVTNQKAGSLVLPPKVVQPLAKDEIGDGVRRQGRSGRSFSATKPSAVTTEKVTVSSSNAKQLRSARVEKSERPGRTPPKKATGERKAITRIRRPSDAGLSLLSPGDSDDDHEELANAVRAAVDASAHACPNKFWKEMEPYFAFVTSDDLCYLRQLAELKLSSDTVSSTPSTDGVERTPRLSDGNLESEMSPDPLEVRTGGRIGGGGGWFDKIYPLSQRLLAALISEGDDEHPDGGACDTKYRDTDSSQRQADGGSYSNGHQNLLSWDDAEVSDIMVDGRQESASLVKQISGTCDSNLITANSRTATGWESQYEQMSLDDRILLELQSIGLVVEQVPDLSQRDEDEICLEICKLQDELKDQAYINKERVETLEKAVLSRREDEARDRERLALSKLIESAYAKRKGCRGSSAAGAKGSGTKAARAAALAFSKRAIARLRQFKSGQSCLGDPTLRDILFCTGTKQSEATAEPVPDGEVSITPALTEVVAPRHGAGKSAPRSRTEKADTSDHPRPGSSWSSQKDTQEDSPQSAPVVRNAAGFGGAKGKRSEREGKGHGKESHRKQDNDRVPRQGMGTVKGERKVKTKPRQKTASLFKDVNGLLGNPTGESSRQRPSASVPRPQERPPAPVLSAPAAEPMDLALVGIPEVLGEHDETQDLGAWLDFTDNNLDAQGELIGLDVPMDDLSDLGMMM